MDILKIGTCSYCHETGIHTWVDDYIDQHTPVNAQDWCNCWRGVIKCELFYGIRYFKWSCYKFAFQLRLSQIKKLRGIELSIIEEEDIPF